MQEQLNAFRGAGLVGDDDFEHYSSRLNELRQQVEKSAMPQQRLVAKKRPQPGRPLRLKRRPLRQKNSLSTACVNRRRQ
jgi:hypothetical protein